MTIDAVLSGEARWAVVEGDCERLLPTLPKVDALITDPPYGIGESGGKSLSRGKITSKRSHMERAAFPVSDWDDKPPADSLIGGLRELAKTQVIFGGNYFSLPPSSCWLVWDKLIDHTDFAHCELAWTNMPKATRRVQYLWSGFCRENKEERGQHPTQKPVGVMMWVLEMATKPGDLILDPFCGSGTTGVAAIRMGRRFIGIEREPAYAAVARERLRAEEKGLTLTAARAGQLSLLA